MKDYSVSTRPVDGGAPQAPYIKTSLRDAIEMQKATMADVKNMVLFLFNDEVPALIDDEPNCLEHEALIVAENSRRIAETVAHMAGRLIE